MLADIVRFMEEHPEARFALVAHQRPDGDALGSMIGLAEALRRQQRPAVLVNPLPFPDNLRFLVAPDLIVHHEADDWWREYDAVGVLDCGEESRLEPVNRAAAARLPAFTIDHHATSDKGLGEAVWIEPEMSSTGEMVVRLCRELGWELTQPAAQALWTAIVTDTGRFCYENTTAAAMAAAQACLAAGADPARTAVEVYQSVTLPQRRLQQTVLERMALFDEGRLAVSWLGRDDFARTGVGVEGSDNGINLLRDTAGVEAAVFFYEPRAMEGVVKASFRTRSPYNALDVATRFGGGGHKRAAGCTVAGTVPEVMERVIEASRKAFFGSA